MTVLDRSKMSHLVVNDETGFLAALEYLILDTSAEALRTIERRQFDEDELAFTRICVSSARDTRRLWTVYSFGPQTPVCRSRRRQDLQNKSDTLCLYSRLAFCGRVSSYSHCRHGLWVKETFKNSPPAER